MSVAALVHPALRLLLQRRPVAGESWISWRLLTSLFVHDGWVPLLFNLAGLVIVGLAVERRVGSPRWAVLYLLGGMVGQFFGIRWQPTGAGNSVACFGLIGGLIALPFRPGRSALPGFALLYAIDWVFVYTGLEFGGSMGAVAAGMLTLPLGGIFARVRGSNPSSPRLNLALAAGTLLLAFVLCVVRDIHGPPLLAGAAAGMLLWPADPAAHQRSPV